METGAIMLLSTDPNVAGETCLTNPLRRSGFQAARHNIHMEPVSKLCGQSPHLFLTLN
jgi:hypothetical protein